MTQKWYSMSADYVWTNVLRILVLYKTIFQPQIEKQFIL